MSFLSSSWLLFRSGIKVVTPAASLLCCSAGVRIAAAGRQRDVMATGGAGGGDADVVSKIGKNLIQNFRTKELCRLGAVKISLLRPTVDANNVKMVAVGLEQLGAQDFVDQRFFDGEVYIDEKRQTYNDLGYKRFSWISIWKALLSVVSRRALSESRSRNISGNFSGDGLQNGGVLIVTKGGDRVLLNHREETPGDHVANNVILEKLGITQVAPTRNVMKECSLVDK